MNKKTTIRLCDFDCEVEISKLSTNSYRAQTTKTVYHKHGRTFIFADGDSEDDALNNLRNSLQEIVDTGFAPHGSLAYI